MTADESPRVFISYAWDSPEHKDSVLKFATFLRVEVGVDVHLDRWYEGQRRDWAAWATTHLQDADFILVIASPAYRRRADGEAPLSEGRGARFEAAVIRDSLFRDLPRETQRVLPVVLPGGSVDDIPAFLCGHSTSHYRVDEFTRESVDSLRRTFSGQPTHHLPRRGSYVPITSCDDNEQRSGPPPTTAHQTYIAEADTMAPGTAVHRTIMLVDIEGFGASRRTTPHQLGARAGLYQVVRDACQAARVPWTRCHVEDRGDAVFVLIPPDVPKGPLVEIVPDALVRAIRAHNHISHDSQRIRLRMAVHAGEVAFDQTGVTSTSVTTTFRLLDATPLKTALAGSPGNLAMIVSEWIFDEVIRHSAAIDPTTFRRVPVAVKETSLYAWIGLPDRPYPSDATALAAQSATDSPRRGGGANTSMPEQGDGTRPQAQSVPQSAASAVDQSSPTVTMIANTADSSQAYQAGRDQHITEHTSGRDR